MKLSAIKPAAIKSIFKSIKMSDIAGIGTILVVFAISVIWLSNASDDFQEKSLLFHLSFFVYLICFVLITRIENNQKTINIYFLLVIQLAVSMILMLNFSIDFLSILTVIWVTLLAQYFSLKQSISIMLVVLSVWFYLYQLSWHGNVIYSALLYATLHFFAIFMVRNTQLAEIATAKATRLNQELIATQQLLTQASRQNERTRIARDLHDLLGHHLTALIINLQVASHLVKIGVM